MAITEPLELMAGLCGAGWTTEFELYRRQDLSRQVNGRTIVRDRGTPLWRMAVASWTLPPNELDAWRARLNAMQNGFRTFRAFPIQRRYPILHPNGDWPTGGAFDGVSAAVHTVGGDSASLRVKSLPPGFAFAVGDYLQVTISSVPFLLNVLEAVTADEDGITPLFAVEPHLPPGIAADQVVAVKEPSCIVAIEPWSITTTSDLSGDGAFSFKAIEAR